MILGQYHDDKTATHCLTSSTLSLLLGVGGVYLFSILLSLLLSWHSAVVCALAQRPTNMNKCTSAAYL